MKGECVQPLNKNITAIKNTEYYSTVKNRNSVILMGDSLGDADMADGMEHCDVVVKVGFLSRKVEENRPAFRENFDIVLENEDSVDVPNAILKLIA